METLNDMIWEAEDDNTAEAYGDPLGGKVCLMLCSGTPPIVDPEPDFTRRICS